MGGRSCADAGAGGRRSDRAVTRLLAQGYTDREIATTLAISVRTAGVHVQRAIAKLGVRSRWQVGDWARDQGIADVEAG